MTISIGSTLPDATLAESTEFGDACPLAPAKISVAAATRGKNVVIFGVPGAYTPTCSAKHVPGYLELLPQLKAKGVDEVWCIAVNDGFVMGAWGRDTGGLGKIRFMGDGSSEFARKLGVDADFSAFGMGPRLQRFSMLVQDGIVKQINVEAPGKFEVSDAATMLKQLEG